MTAGGGSENDLQPCVYCGMPASSVDHVIPRAFMAAMDSLVTPLDKARRTFGHVVAACLECNVLLGSCAMHTEAQRRDFVKEKLKNRYHRLLSSPEWEESELLELSGRLLEAVRASQARRDLIRARLRWPRP